MAMMRVCIRSERQDTVREVMQQLRTTDPKIAVDWIIADWLSKRDQIPLGHGQPMTTATVSLDIQEW